MIIGEHTIIRAAEADDAATLQRLYDPRTPRTFHLGPNLEMRMPTLEEIRQLIEDKDNKLGDFIMVEDMNGDVIGCTVLRLATGNTPYGEAVFAFFREQDYTEAAADEAFLYVRKQAFTIKKRRKLMAHCLETEPAYREFLVRNGFTSNGVQRQLIYTRSRYHDFESLSLFPESG